MDLPGNFAQVMAFCPNSQVSNKVLVLIKDFFFLWDAYCTLLLKSFLV